MQIRYMTEREHTYRIATTAPYYFEIGDQPRISRRAVSFFSQWLEKTAELIAAEDPTTAAAAQPFLDSARKFWQQKLAATNVE